jgi:hypothetical protein
LFACLAVTLSFAPAAEPASSPGVGCFISTGDNHWLGESLPIDSKASIEDSFALLGRLGEHTVTNSRIEAHGGTAGISVDTAFKTSGLDSCTLVLDNVVVTGPKGVPSGANHIQVRGAKGRLEISHADLSDMSLSASAGAGIVLNASVVRGNSPFTISVPAGCSWVADGNLYGDGKFQIGDNTYLTKDFATYQGATKQEGSSHMIDDATEVGSDSPKKSLPGADLSRIP